MKKIITVFLLTVVSFGLVACGGSTNFEKMQEDLEDQGFEIEIENVDDDLDGVSIMDYSDAEFHYLISDDKISAIMFENNELYGIVAIDNKELEELLNLALDDDAIDAYKEALKDIGYSEKQMKDFALWYLDNN